MEHTKWRADRLDRLGSAIFAEVAAWKEKARNGGTDVIALDIGSPDRPPALPVREALAAAAMREDLYRYPGTEGTKRFRETVARWYGYRFGVELDPEREVLSLMGTQDGLGHLALAFANPGDAALLPDPGYPVYGAGLAVGGVEAIPLPLTEENGFLPDFDAIPDAVWARVKFMILNYPSNPLSAVADLAFLERAVREARRRGVLLVYDNAYSEMAFDGFRPPSVLQVPGAKETAVEFHSLSKTYNLAGARLGFAVGSREALASLRALKDNIDFGVFLAVQEAGIKALELDMAGALEPVAEVYRKRRDVLVAGLRQAGWHVPVPKATMFLWAPVPEGWTSRAFSQAMLEGAGVASVPGSAFGDRGEGHVRLAIVESEARLQEAAERIAAWLPQSRP
ncbi:aminotransferase class I/II-fold pyridoxal phosphate-dependent enzyme [Cohnella caldifontis]|uniref:aminotransferase class I/II-fold pyridoxal phosphate-dependent enzyme n=1 Tax=Cohnella caldifontis TaxID=3027471 RepID=UPI0023EB4A87|nr:aminotransferase class I/II-fold pyridoxal phosphate-dependent enzyme [Cohnella sp. YIM B05605]